MASFPLGDISTQPNSKVVFNAPYDDKHTYHIKIINAGGRRVGYRVGHQDYELEAYKSN